ncbi:MAG: hypothetical protein CMH78_02315 [Nitrospinae bacterium]|jgi:hypothetical protein|nr:hypothetical protein [Nitrospinota bacterium]
MFASNSHKRRLILIVGVGVTDGISFLSISMKYFFSSLRFTFELLKAFVLLKGVIKFYEFCRISLQCS